MIMSSYRHPEQIGALNVRPVQDRLAGRGELSLYGRSPLDRKELHRCNHNNVIRCRQRASDAPSARAFLAVAGRTREFRPRHRSTRLSAG